MVTLANIPPHYKHAAARRKGRLIEALHKATQENEQAKTARLWKALLLFDACMFARPEGEGSRTLNKQISHRLNHFDQAAWHELWREAKGPDAKKLRVDHRQTDQREVQNIMRLLEDGLLGRVTQRIAEPTHMASGPDMANKLRDLFPPASEALVVDTAVVDMDQDMTEMVNRLVTIIENAIAAAPTKLAAGTLGSRFEHWQLGAGARQRRQLAELLAGLLLGKGPADVLGMIGTGRLIPLLQTNKTIRPVAATHVLRRFIAKGLAMEATDLARPVLDKMQHGSGMKEGAAILVHRVEAALAARPTAAPNCLDIKTRSGA